MGRLPEAYVATATRRELRELVRHRAKLVALRSGLKAHVHGVLAKQGLLPEMSDVFGPAGQVWLQAAPLDLVYRQRIHSLLELIDAYDGEIGLFRQMIAGLTTLTEVPRTCSLKFPTHGAAGRRVAGWRKEVPSTLRLPGRRPSKGPGPMLTWEEELEAEALFKRGWTISAIARHLGRDRKTIRAYLSGERIPGVRRRVEPGGVRAVRRLRGPAVGR